MKVKNNFKVGIRTKGGTEYMLAVIQADSVRHKITVATGRRNYYKVESGRIDQKLKGGRIFQTFKQMESAYKGLDMRIVLMITQAMLKNVN